MIYQTEETRDRILSAAQRLFVERGLFATQMQDIAHELHISRTSLYRYYQDKFELATAILNRILYEIDREWETTQNQAKPLRTGREEVEFYLREFLLSDRFAIANYYMAEFDAFFSGVRITPTVHDGIAEAVRVEKTSLLVPALSRGIADGSIRSDIDPHLASVTLYNSVKSLYQRLVLRGRALIEVQTEELPRMMTELVRYLIRGISAEVSSKATRSKKKESFRASPPRKSAATRDIDAKSREAKRPPKARD